MGNEIKPIYNKYYQLYVDDVVDKVRKSGFKIIITDDYKDEMNNKVATHYFIIKDNNAMVLFIHPDYLNIEFFAIINQGDGEKVHISNNKFHITSIEELHNKFQESINKKDFKEFSIKGYQRLEHKNLDKMGFFEIKKYNDFKF